MCRAMRSQVPGRPARTAGYGKMPGAAGVAIMVVSGHGKLSSIPAAWGIAAENRLGVGLGGDRRVWRCLSSILTQPQPTANRQQTGR
jgi:hypothetical protein